MGATTGVQWTGKTYNPWQGCHKRSPGCAHCYMFRDKLRYGQDPATVVRSKDATFYAPLKWKEPDLVFTCSWSDFFIEEADPWRAEVWDLIRRTPHLTYQILTKRTERIAACLPDDWGAGYPNVWLGTSVENQHWADVRIPLLLQVPAAVRFLSCEPLLGPVDLRPYLTYWHLTHRNGEPFYPTITDYNVGTPWATEGGTVHCHEKINWVIVGGESGGHEARPFDPAWAESIVTQCRAAGVAPFVKQLGSVWARAQHAHDGHGGDMAEWPDALRVREFPAAVEVAA